MQNGLVILAAGLGTRFHGVKQLTPVGPTGDVILDYSASAAVGAGFERIVLVTRSAIYDAMAAHVRDRWPASVHASIVCQDTDPQMVATGRDKPLGTVHAALVGLREADAAFTAVINADDHYGAPPFGLLAGIGAGMGMVTFPVSKTVITAAPVTRALCSVADQHLTGIEEGTVDGSTWTGTSGRVVELAGDEPVSMNFWGFDRTVMEPFEAATAELVASGDQTREVLLPDLVRSFLESGRTVATVATDGACIGLTHPDDVELVRAAITEPAWPT